MGGGAAASWSPQELKKKTRPEFKTKRRKCPNGAERRVGGAVLGACALLGPAPTLQPGGGGSWRGRVRGVVTGRKRVDLGSEASGERRVLEAGSGAGRGQREQLRGGTRLGACDRR